MQRAARGIPRQAFEVECLCNHALPGEGRVAVDQHGHDLVHVVEVVAHRQRRADLAEHDRVDRFEVRGVGDQAHVHLDPVEIAVRRSAEVVLHVARPADVLGVGGAA